HGGDAQLLQISDARTNAAEVGDAVTIPVLRGAGVDMVDDSGFPRQGGGGHASSLRVRSSGAAGLLLVYHGRPRENRAGNTPLRTETAARGAAETREREGEGRRGRDHLPWRRSSMPRTITYATRANTKKTSSSHAMPCSDSITVRYTSSTQRLAFSVRGRPPGSVPHRSGFT